METLDASAGSDAPADALSGSDALPDTATDTPISDAAGDLADHATELSCTLSPSGTCEPAPDSTLGECNGCYEVKGQVFDSERGCLKDAAPIVVECTTICTAGAAFECYTRGAEPNVEVVLSSYSYLEPDDFESETGFVPCESDLRDQVLAAAPCPAD